MQTLVPSAQIRSYMTKNHSGSSGRAQKVDWRARCRGGAHALHPRADPPMRLSILATGPYIGRIDIVLFFFKVCFLLCVFLH